MGRDAPLERDFAHPLIEAEHRRQGRDLLEAEQALRLKTIPEFVSRLQKQSATEARDFLPISYGPGGVGT